MDVSSRIYVIRHGETIWNQDQLLQGRQNIPLTERGFEQAQEKANKFTKMSLAFIGASPLDRTQQTALVISSLLKIPAITIPELQPRCYGSWEGKNVVKLKEEYADLFKEMKKWSLEDIFSKSPLEDVESYETVSERVMKFLNNIIQTYPNQNSLLITHSGVITAILLSLKAPTKEIPLISQDGYVEISYSYNQFKLEKVVGLIQPKGSDTNCDNYERVHDF